MGKSLEQMFRTQECVDFWVAYYSFSSVTVPRCTPSCSVASGLIASFSSSLTAWGRICFSGHLRFWRLIVCGGVLGRRYISCDVSCISYHHLWNYSDPTAVHKAQLISNFHILSLSVLQGGGSSSSPSLSSSSRTCC